MPSDDLIKDIVSSNIDLFELFGLDTSFTQKALERAYRRGALSSHPDKVGNDPLKKEQFHLIQIGFQILSDATTRSIYENVRNAKLHQKRQSELFEGRRRELKHDLEAREKGVKRRRDEEDNDQEKLERKIRQLAEDGKRLRTERENVLKKEMEQEKVEDQIHISSPVADGASSVPELDRTVKVRWPIEGRGDMVTESDITTLFSTFGLVESVTLLGPKTQKKKKQIAVICMVQYASIVGAHSAVKDFPKQKGKEWERFDLVFWAGNKEPDSISEKASEFNNAQHSSATASPSTPARRNQSPAAFLDRGSQPATPTPSGDTPKGHGPRKMPSFSSFSAASFGTPKGSPLSRDLGVNSPSLEELTMIRLKNAERKRLAEELQREDDTAT